MYYNNRNDKKSPPVCEACSPSKHSFIRIEKAENKFKSNPRSLYLKTTSRFRSRTTIYSLSHLLTLPQYPFLCSTFYDNDLFHLCLFNNVVLFCPCRVIAPGLLDPFMLRNSLLRCGLTPMN